MPKISSIKIILITPIFFLFSHYLAVFPHEYAHSAVAWLAGFKTNPLVIQYGGTSWGNLLLLLHIDEHVNYPAMLAAGHPFIAALAAFAGPGIANVILYFLSLYLLTKSYIETRPYLFYFLVWFNFVNIANFYDYVPIRSFADHADIGHITTALHISPWWIMVIFGYPTALAIWHFYRKTLIKTYLLLEINNIWGKVSLLLVFTLILFGFFGTAGFIGYDVISHFLSTLSLYIIPIVIVACWPTREWVIMQSKKI